MSSSPGVPTTSEPVAHQALRARVALLRSVSLAAQGGTAGAVAEAPPQEARPLVTRAPSPLPPSLVSLLAESSGSEPPVLTPRHSQALALARTPLVLGRELASGRVALTLPDGRSVQFEAPERPQARPRPGTPVRLESGGSLVPIEPSGGGTSGGVEGAQERTFFRRAFMDPLSNAAATAVARPVGTGVEQRLNAFLVEGRVMEGRVEAVAADGAVTFAIGRDRVVATTSAELTVGQELKLEAFRLSSGEPALRVQVTEGRVDSAPRWWSQLKSTLAESRPIGTILSEVATRLRANLARLDFSASQATAVPGRPPALLPAAPVLEELGRVLSAHTFDANAPDAARLQELLQRGGTRLEAHLARALADGPSAARAFVESSGDLKLELGRILRDLPEGPLREAVSRALVSIEAEQWVNLARARAGESQVWSLPIPDAHGWSTARLWVARDRTRSGDRNKGSGGSDRLTLSLRLSALGPVRADVVSNEERTFVRILVDRPELAQRIRQDLELLAPLLARGERRVDLAVRVGATEELSPERSLLDLPAFRRRQMTDFVA